MEGFTIRDYQEHDEEQLRNTDVIRSGISRFVYLQPIYITDIPKKAAQYDSSFVLVAENMVPDNEPNSGKKTLCGTLMCGIKSVYIFGIPNVKIGYIFDLKVDPVFRRQGIASAMVAEAEDRCRQHGAEYMYLSVNAINNNARKFYKRLSYSTASTRKPSIQFVLQPKPSPNIKVEKISKEDAKTVLSRFKTNNLALSDVTPLLDSPHYLGTFLARTSAFRQGESVAGLSLWNSSDFRTFRFTRIFIPTEWWFSLPMKFAGVCGVALSLAASYKLGVYLWRIDKRRFSACAAGVSISFFYLARAVHYFLQILIKVTSDETSQKWKCRVFAPFYEGPAGQQLLKDLLVFAYNEAYKLGFLTLLCNLSRKDSIYECFPKTGFTTLFLMKCLAQHKVSGESHGQREEVEFGGDVFFDPRDL